MAGQLKEVRNRIKSVQNTQQITKAMKMVSAAKLRRAQDSIIQMRPYAKKLREMLAHVVGGYGGDIDMSLFVLAKERPIEKVLMIPITSDRGLAGAYNSNIIKLTKQVVAEKYSEQFRKGNVTVWPIGKKGFEHFLKTKYIVDAAHKDIFLKLAFDQVQVAAQAAVQAFKEKQFDAVEIVFSEFRNAATQRFIAERFLPIARITPQPGARKLDFILEPSKTELIEELVPKILNTQLFKAVLDANASEHGARMTAMDKASENANDILKELRISYNRARQAAITTELTEIVSGAAALQGA
jgi:F-type H+-transporting ATPase subunit gamma